MQIRMVQKALASWFQCCASGGFPGIYEEYRLPQCHLSIVTKTLVGIKEGNIIWGFRGLILWSSDSIVLSLKWARASWGFWGMCWRKRMALMAYRREVERRGGWDRGHGGIERIYIPHTDPCPCIIMNVSLSMSRTPASQTDENAVVGQWSVHLIELYYCPTELE